MNKNIPIKIATIEEAICRASNVKINDIRGRSRAHELVAVRQAVWYVAHEYLGYRYSALARIYDRDHTTIIHGVKKIKEDQFGAICLVEGIRKVCPEVLENPSGEKAKTLKNWVF